MVVDFAVIAVVVVVVAVLVVVVADVVFDVVVLFVAVAESVCDEVFEQLHLLTSNQGFRSFLSLISFSFRQAPPLMLHLRIRF